MKWNTLIKLTQNVVSINELFDFVNVGVCTDVRIQFYI